MVGVGVGAAVGVGVGAKTAAGLLPCNRALIISKPISKATMPPLMTMMRLCFLHHGALSPTGGGVDEELGSTIAETGWSMPACIMQVLLMAGQAYSATRSNCSNFLC